jgi:acyl-CoA synthetase (AMP-forming)/AMP-acid ligase II
MNGYLDAPELTAAAFQGEWFRTGDIAREREDGVVELTGRAKELISRGGNKISPLELEQVFAAHPDVAGAMAAGAADPILGERIHVLVVPRPGRTLTQETLRLHAASRLPKFRQPDVYYIADALPLGRTGKADRGALRAMIERGELDGS